MSGKRVLIVSSHGLFREGFKQLLAGTIDLTLSDHASSLQEAEELVRAEPVDVVIIDQADDEECRTDAITSLLSMPGDRVVIVSSNTGNLCVYRREQVEEASIEDLVAALDG